MIYLKSRSSWLKHNKEISPAAGGRKRFDVHKNRESIKEATSIRYSQTPIKQLKSERRHYCLDISAESNSQNFQTKTKLTPINENYYKKKLIEKESEINLLKNMYNNTNQQLLNIKNKLVYNRPSIENFRPVNVSRTDLTPEPRIKSHLDVLKQRIFSQPKYTKSNPKIVFSNPITGISPSFAFT